MSSMSDYIGLSRHNGRRLVDVAHLRQSIGDILTTPLGSRVMRRTYGSDLPDLLDQPMTDVLKLRLYAAATYAIMKWEPRIGRVLRMELLPSADQPGRATLDIELVLATGDRLTLAGIVL